MRSNPSVAEVPAGCGSQLLRHQRVTDRRVLLSCMALIGAKL